MNIQAVIDNVVPYTVFFTWKTQALNVFPQVQRRDYSPTNLSAVQVSRVNRFHMRDLSKGKARKEDCGYHRSNTVLAIREAPVPFLNIDSAKLTMQYRITSTTNHNETFYWHEQHHTNVITPKHIVFTNYGWQTLESFMRNTHMLLYVPTMGTHDYITRANFVNVDRDNLVWSEEHGWYDVSQHDIVNKKLYEKGNSYYSGSDLISITGVSLSIPDAMFDKVRTATRKLIRLVRSGELSVREAQQAFRSMLWDTDAITRGHYRHSIEFDKMWRGFYTKGHRTLVPEIARLIREITVGVRLHTGMFTHKCRTCSAPIPEWTAYETLVLEGDEAESERTIYYCSVEHAQQDRSMFTETPLPRKYSYTENVLNHMRMGDSKYLAPKGEQVRVGVELETYHSSLASPVLPANVVGGTITKKMPKHRTKVAWNLNNYRKWGAIPVHDGSLNTDKGIEWVFRPSDLQGMEKDLHNFMVNTRGMIEYDADTADYVATDESRTYGLHTHVTATDAMKGVAARIRITVVGEALHKVIQAIGGRGYSHYTRRYSPAVRILNMHKIRAERSDYAAYVRSSNKPAWMAYTVPQDDNSHTHRSHMLVVNRIGEASPRLMSGNHPIMANYTDRDLFVKYNMINVCFNKPTIEMRHGRSFVNENNIMLNAELSQAVVLFATYEVMSIRQCVYDKMPTKFAHYVWSRRKTYPRLARWLMQQVHRLGTDFVAARSECTLARYGG